MSSHLDPKEVLMHLHELGYKKVPEDKLKLFIEDLKRLMKYDSEKRRKLLESQRNRCAVSQSEATSMTPNTTQETSSPRPLSGVQRHHHHCRDGPPHTVEHARRDPPVVCLSSSESSVAAGRTVLRECDKYAAQQPHRRNVVHSSRPLKRLKPCDHNWRNLGCESCDEKWHEEQNKLKMAKSKENVAPRPKTSFIRSGQGSSQLRSQRCDPVTLYHQYQQLWKQQKLPGENNHNELRWSIRERMLGQDPQIRPPSQASSVSSVNRRQKRL